MHKRTHTERKPEGERDFLSWTEYSKENTLPTKGWYDDRDVSFGLCVQGTLTTGTKIKKGFYPQ